MTGSPLGQFKRIGNVLQQYPAIATGAGHHSVLHVPAAAAAGATEDAWYIVYDRRPKGRTGANERVTCIDRMEFDDKGFIRPVKITREGVEAKPLRATSSGGEAGKDRAGNVP